MTWNKERYANDAEYRERFLARQRARRLANRDEFNARRWGQDLQRLYGISQADYGACLQSKAGGAPFAGNYPRTRGCASIIVI
jgi:hypothetical protein